MLVRRKYGIVLPFEEKYRPYAFLHEILDLTTDCLLLVDVKTQLIIYINKACEGLYGYLQDEIIGQPISLLNTADTNSVAREMQSTINKYPNPYRFETVHARKNKQPIPVEVISKLVTINSRQYFLSHITNITKQKVMQNEIERLIRRLSTQAYRDHLTKCYNRAYLFNVYLRRLKKAEIGLLLIDIDFFKDINDRFGHHYGDQILIAAVGRIQSCIRSDDKVIRYGGDEFLTILPNLTAEETALVGKRVQDAFNESNLGHGRHYIRCSVSIGIAHGMVDGAARLDLLLHQADLSLYEQKALRPGSSGWHLYEYE